LQTRVDTGQLLCLLRKLRPLGLVLTLGIFHHALHGQDLPLQRFRLSLQPHLLLRDMPIHLGHVIDSVGQLVMFGLHDFLHCELMLVLGFQVLIFPGADATGQHRETNDRHAWPHTVLLSYDRVD
jgi:hypothetical protein